MQLMDLSYDAPMTAGGGARAAQQPLSVWARSHWAIAKNYRLAATQKGFAPMALAFDRNLLEPLLVLSAVGLFLVLPFLIPA